MKTHQAATYLLTMIESDKEIFAEPQSSCFNRSDFMSDDFQVDRFVAECKKVVSLNVFKKELDDYLKSLKNALIELINQDYADFVNLSTNLVSVEVCEVSKLHVLYCIVLYNASTLPGSPVNVQCSIYRTPKNKRTNERTKQNQRENKEQRIKNSGIKGLQHVI